jgi:hypothetical protein
MLGRVFVANGSLLALTFKGFTIKSFDLCQFTKCPLSDAGKTFNTKNRKLEGFDHELIEAEYSKGASYFYDYFLNLSDISTKVREYQISDVETTKEVFDIVDKAVFELTGCKMVDSMTLASLGYKYFSILYKQKWISENGEDDENAEDLLEQHPSLIKTKVSTCPTKFEKADTLIRKAMIGGRTEVMSQCNTVESDSGFAQLDVKSLYPYVMNNGNKFLNHNATPISTKTYKAGYIGFYECEINQSKDATINILPRRGEEKLDWKYKGKLCCTLTSVDIEACKLYYGVENVVVKNGYYFSKEDETTDIFDKYISGFKHEKNRQDKLKTAGSDTYNPGLRAMAKLFMNSLSGKLMQRNFTEASGLFLSTSTKEIEKFIKTLEVFDLQVVGDNLIRIMGSLKIENIYKSAKPAFNGCLIYSYARQHMNRVYSINPEANLYTDTDSLLIKAEYLHLYKDFIGEEFGDLENELEGKTSTKVIMPCAKTYAIFNDKKVVKARSKGVKLSSRWKMNENDEFEVDKIVESYDFYEALASGKELQVESIIFSKGVKMISNDWCFTLSIDKTIKNLKTR